ncbi:MAG: hypothetical protein RR458_00935 [Clostridia bacterium]
MKTKKILITIALVVVFIASVALVIYGQQNIGYLGLGLMLLGLGGILVLLYLYNRQFK